MTRRIRLGVVGAATEDDPLRACGAICEVAKPRRANQNLAFNSYRLGGFLGLCDRGKPLTLGDLFALVINSKPIA